ncbi:MAG TPA: glycosyltransferase family 4 protein [Thermoanaerobaculia bacterium]
MRIAYVLPYPELNGGNKVIFQHAGLLRDNGDEVTVLGEGPRPDWIDIGGEYQDYSVSPPRLREQDLVIATYWTTLPLARQLGAGPVAHFCQGYEGGLAHLQPLRPRIEEVYSWKVPALTVSPHLADLLRQRFGRESVVVPPPLDPLFRPAWRLRPRRRPRIAVPGIFEAEVKDVPTALEAVRRLRGQGIACRLLRFSVMPLCEEERALLPADLFLSGVPPREIARALRRCDLLLFASRAEEGFGLPLLEAMASGVPAVASRIPSTADMAEGVAALVPPGDAEAFSAAARELVSNPSAWRRARALGIQAAGRFRPEAVAPRLIEGVRWARDWALRYPPGP